MVPTTISRGSRTRATEVDRAPVVVAAAVVTRVNAPTMEASAAGAPKASRPNSTGKPNSIRSGGESLTVLADWRIADEKDGVF